MYATCIFCNGALGSNEALEHFPVGRRLAFDAEKGRLWVVCRRCTRWNLSPLEERWEALEEAERLFRATRLRVSTEHVGLARVHDGTELVRIGRPQRPELAAWRYGEQFTRRRRRQMILTGAALVGGGAAFAGGVMAAGLSLVMVQLGVQIWKLADRGLPDTTVARLRDPRGTVIDVHRQHLLESTIGTGRDGGLALKVRHTRGSTRMEGDDARRAAMALFPAVNRRGGTADEVTSAVGRLERAGSAEQFLADTARRGAKLSKVVKSKQEFAFDHEVDLQDHSGLLALSPTLGLAIEMALHEERERRALEGELAELEEAWRDAEEIAAISDSLLLPDGVKRALELLRRPGR